MPAAVASFNSCVTSMPVCTRICLLAASTESTLVIFSSRSVTEVTLLAGLMADGVGAAAEVMSGTGLLAQSGWVRWELPGHTNGAELWKALHAMKGSSRQIEACTFCSPVYATVHTVLSEFLWSTADALLQVADRGA